MKTMDSEGKTASKWRKRGRMQVNTQENRIPEKYPLKQFLFLFLCKEALKLHWENKGGKLLYSNAQNKSNLNLFNTY